MNNMRYAVKVNMVDNGLVRTAIRVKQGDSGIVFAFKVYNGEQEYFDANDKPIIVFNRPDGSTVVGECAVNENQYTYKVVGNELQYAGLMSADLKFNPDTDIESTATFMFESVKNTYNDNAEGAEVYVNSLKEIKAYIADLVAKLEQEMEELDIQRILAEIAVAQEKLDRIEADAAKAAEDAEKAVEKVAFAKESSNSFDINTSIGGIRINEIDGVTHKSKNLLNPTLETTTQNGVTCKNNGDGTYTLNGTASATSYFRVEWAMNLVSGKQYKLLGMPNVQEDVHIRISDDTIATYVGQYNGVIFTNNLTDGLIFVAICVNAGVSCNNITFKPMLTEDLSATFDDFEPYGLTTSGSTAYDDKYALVVEEKGANLIDVKPFSTDGGNTILNIPDIELGKQYVWSGKFADGTALTSESCTMIMNFTDGSTEYASPNAPFSISKQLNEFIFYYNGNKGRTTISDFMLNEGTAPTPYTPYKSNTVFIPLSKPICSVGDIHDTITKKDGKWGVERRFGYDMLRNFGWGIAGQGSNSFYAIPENIKPNGRIVCNKYKEIYPYNADAFSSDDKFITNGNGAFLVRDTSCSDVNSLRDSNVNTIIIYELVTPYFEEITDQSTLYMLESFADKTYIDTAEGLAILNIEYGQNDTAAASLNGERLAMYFGAKANLI